MNTNPTIVPVIDVIELGVATTLTMGGGSNGWETRQQPFGSLQC
jgi:hypothetical protein